MMDKEQEKEMLMVFGLFLMEKMEKRQNKTRR